MRWALELPGPSGWRQLARSTYRHHCSGSLSDTGRFGAEKTAEPDCYLPSGTPR